MRIVVFGLTISSSWGNGHATLWRGLCKYLVRAGHSVVFFERDVPYYAGARDFFEIPGGRLVLYSSWDDVRSAADGPGDVTRVELTPVRRAIAANLERQASIPQVTTFRTVDCTAVQLFRQELDVSPLPVVVAALCEVAKDHPLVNARWSPDAILASNAVNAGLAIDTERGLVVAVIRDAHSLGIATIAAESTRLAEGARAGSLTSNDIAGATIAVSNTGSYGSEAGTPILSPGTSVTLAIGVIADRALVIDGRVVARPAATLSLTFDHRVLDGAAAGRALTGLVDLLQSDDRLRHLPR